MNINSYMYIHMYTAVYKELKCNYVYTKVNLKKYILNFISLLKVLCHNGPYLL